MRERLSPPSPLDDELRVAACRLLSALQEYATLRDPAEVIAALADAAWCLDGGCAAWAEDLVDVVQAAEVAAIRSGVRDPLYREARQLVGLGPLLRRDGDPVLRSAVIQAFEEFTERVRLRSSAHRCHLRGEPQIGSARPGVREREDV